jgi:hypothetical protein
MNKINDFNYEIATAMGFDPDEFVKKTGYEYYAAIDSFNESNKKNNKSNIPEERDNKKSNKRR